MSRTPVLALALTLLPTGLLAQSIAGIHVGDPASALDKLNLRQTARATTGSMDTVKYTLANGNELSVTYQSPAGRVVYIECDWNRDPASAASDFPGFQFGVTTLERIRIANGSNGFSYKSNAMNVGANELFAFNAYSIEDKPGLVGVFVTAVKISELRRRRDNKEPSAEDVAKNLTLDALIIAEESYLDEIWGKEKIYDPNVKPMKWSATTENPHPNSR
jgi:hypothetical protein